MCPGSGPMSPASHPARLKRRERGRSQLRESARLFREYSATSIVWSKCSS
jgi:hypothetical protein